MGSEVVSKIHKDPTVDKSGVVVLLGQVLGVCGKRESSVRGTFLPPQILSQKSQTVGVCENKFQITCSNFMKIQRLKNPGSLFYLDRFECMRKKERVLEKEEGRTDLRGENVETRVTHNVSIYS